ncbi:hypothetical protein RchiOBHm_Chr6g0274291 [Rosa chinensis]|uniref:Uncharacterized protein n=1 Tax=Rosa chinensis TaxID=74649 RepID=A0A2P6PRP6_ROSCH|nr:hypothetical protein RchiOBHm_Chr6g0274291 [Rosa chinensis]
MAKRSASPEWFHCNPFTDIQGIRRLIKFEVIFRGFRYIQRLVDQFPPVKAFHFVLDHTEDTIKILSRLLHRSLAEDYSSWCGLEQGEFHPPTSRMTNYVVFKFGERTRSYNKFSWGLTILAIWASLQNAVVFHDFMIATTGKYWQCCSKPAYVA